MDPLNEDFTIVDHESFMTCVATRNFAPDFNAAPPIPGRLGQAVEGGGKRPIFAIGNWFNQRLLKPFHDWLMSVLRGWNF